jgi:hypothetical protein
MGAKGRGIMAGALISAAGLLALAALVAHAWINARAAADFRRLGVPPFEYAWRDGLLRVVGTPRGAANSPTPPSPSSGLHSPTVLPGDQIARVAGMPVEDTPRWRHHLLWRVNGRPLHLRQQLPLTVVRAGVAREVVVSLGGISAGQITQLARIQAMLLLKQAAGFGLWLLGVLVLFRRRDAVTRLFFLWCLALALYTAGSVVAAPLWDSYPSAPIRLFRTGFMAGWFLAPALFGHFCWTFVSALPAQRWRRMLPALFYMLPLVALGITNGGVLGRPGSAVDSLAFGWLWRLLWYGLAAGWLATLALGFTTLIRGHRAAADARRRKQIELVLVGSLAYAAVFLHAFITVLARWDAHPSGVWAWLPYVLLPLTPLAFAYAILRHDLLDLRLVIRRSLVYALLTICMAGVFIVLQHLTGVALQARTGATSLSAQTFAALAVAALFGPTERRLARLVESLFNREHGRRLDQLRDLGQQIDLPESSTPLERLLAERVVEILEVDGAALYWLDSSNGQFRPVTAHGPAMDQDAPATFLKSGSLAGWLTHAGAPLDLTALPREEPARRLEPSEREQLAAMGTTLCVPMMARGALAGFLVLGSKHDQERFSPPEREALLTLASLAARALQQAELSRRIRELEQERADLIERLRLQERRSPHRQPASR